MSGGVAVPLGNPYIVERPLAEGDTFVGRHKALFGVLQSIRRGQRFTLVYGLPRIGKTSFLRQLRKELTAGFVVLSVDMVWPGADETGTEGPREVAALAVRQLQARIGEQLHGQGGGTAQDSSVGVLAADLRALPESRVVVLVDGLSLQNLKGELGSEFVAQWQGWMSSMPGMHCVMALEGHVDGVLSVNPALTSLPSVQLEGFDLQETEELLLGPAQDRLTYEFAAIRHIWQLTAGHPYFVQLFGHVLFAARPGGWRVSSSDVDRIVDRVLVSAGSVMEQIWQPLSPQGKLLLALSGELRGSHGVLHVRELDVATAQRGLELDKQEIEDGLAELLAVGVVRRLSGDSYSLSAELVRLWLAKYRPLAQTLSELKGHKYTLVPRRSGLARSRGSVWGVSLVGMIMVAFVALLWNMRGSAQRSSMGSVPTATPPPFATRATLVIGPALGRIVYQGREDPDARWDIWLMRADGSDPQRLTDDPADDMSPTWSPDGKSVAFVSERDGNREIYLMQADGTQQLNLTRNPSEDWTPAWSPDGASIAFASYRDGNWEVYVMDADGANPRRVTSHSAADYGPCWSADGQHIVFQSNRDGNWEIYVINADGTGLARLTDNESTDLAPAWSPDGAEIAFESYRDGNMEIYVMAADGTAQRNVSNEPYSNDHGPAWAWNGTQLVDFSNRDGGWDIFSMKPDGTEKMNLTLSPAQEQGPEWHE